MKIYTKSGDDGKTALFQGARVEKDDARIEAYGTVDELSSVLGLARATSLPASVDGTLAQIQQDLFVLGTELATDSSNPPKLQITPAHSVEIERQIDHYDAQLPPLTNFILPTGTPGAATLHHARVVCRRAERRIVTLARASALSPDGLIYLNRVGDLLFVLARFANHAEGTPDVPWQAPQTSSDT